jgi:uncharacterized membrane protein
MGNRATIWLTALLLVGLPTLAQASEVDHIMAGFFGMVAAILKLLFWIVVIIAMIYMVTTRK